MKQTTITLIAALSLALAAACAKEKQDTADNAAPAATAAITEVPAAKTEPVKTNVDAKAQLMVLKFHHDS